MNWKSGRDEEEWLLKINVFIIGADTKFEVPVSLPTNKYFFCLLGPWPLLPGFRPQIIRKAALVYQIRAFRITVEQSAPSGQFQGFVKSFS